MHLSPFFCVGFTIAQHLCLLSLLQKNRYNRYEVAGMEKNGPGVRKNPGPA